MVTGNKLYGNRRQKKRPQRGRTYLLRIHSGMFALFEDAFYLDVKPLVTLVSLASPAVMYIRRLWRRLLKNNIHVSYSLNFDALSRHLKWVINMGDYQLEGWRTLRVECWRTLGFRVGCWRMGHRDPVLLGGASVQSAFGIAMRYNLLLCTI